MSMLFRLALPALLLAGTALSAAAQTAPATPPSAPQGAAPAAAPQAAPAEAQAQAPVVPPPVGTPIVTPQQAAGLPATAPAEAPAATPAPAAGPAIAQPAPVEPPAAVATPASAQPGPAATTQPGTAESQPAAQAAPPSTPATPAVAQPSAPAEAPAAQPASAQPVAPAQPATPPVAAPAQPSAEPPAQPPVAQPAAPTQPPVAQPAEPTAPQQQPILTDSLPTPPVAPGPGPVIVRPSAPAEDPNMPVGFDPRACPVLNAPFAQGEVPNPSEAWGGTDSGVVITGHARLRNPDPSRPPARQMLGVDVSRHNTVNYDVKARCGTQFAFIRMDDRYNAHATEFEKRNIRPLPYYYMPVSRDLRRPEQYARLTDTPATQADVDRFLTIFEQIGRQQAERFFQRMRDLKMAELPLVVVRDQDGRIQAQARPIAVDIEEKLDPEPTGANADNARIYYGRFYAKAVCAWVREVQTRLRDQQPLVVMYTTPSVWGDYLYAAYPAEAECLNALPIWVSRTTSDGGDVIRSSRNRNDLYAARLCTASGANRCVVHQYSHRGQLGAAAPQGRNVVPHFDLNRFFLVRPVQTGGSIMFVREQD